MIGNIRILFWVGIFMLFVPFLGIPDSVKVLFAVAIGILLITLSFMLRKKYKILKFKLRRLEQPVVDQSIHG